MSGDLLHPERTFSYLQRELKSLRIERMPGRDRLFIHVMALALDVDFSNHLFDFNSYRPDRFALDYSGNTEPPGRELPAPGLAEEARREPLPHYTPPAGFKSAC